MPSLTWPGKRVEPPPPRDLHLDSIIYPAGRGYPDAPARDRLIFGENLQVMASLLPEYEGRIDLIYADPPFFTNRQYAARIGRGEDSRKPSEWSLAEGYADSWVDLDEYLEFLFQRLMLMHRLLSSTGTLYLHLDWHADSYGRLMLDEIFGPERLLNEIIWIYHGPSPIRSAFNRKHDTLLSYAKGDTYTFNADAVRQPYHPATVKTFKASPRAGFGKMPDLERGKVPEDWWYFPVVARLHKERTGYPTQKPEALLERIIMASSNPGDVVADFFCGSGTTAAVAARSQRRYIAADNSFRAIHTTRRRLCTLPTDPFTIEQPIDSLLPLEAGSAPQVRRSLQGLALEQNTNLDYWEIDPDWDGLRFRSAAQAQRPNGRSNLPLSLQIETGRRPCVRFVTVGGEVMQRELDV